MRLQGHCQRDVNDGCISERERERVDARQIHRLRFRSASRWEECTPARVAEVRPDERMSMLAESHEGTVMHRGHTHSEGWRGRVERFMTQDPTGADWLLRTEKRVVKKHQKTRTRTLKNRRKQQDVVTTHKPSHDQSERIRGSTSCRLLPNSSDRVCARRCLCSA